jgi:Ca2+-binding RTX toxin-like protein
MGNNPSSSGAAVTSGIAPAILPFRSGPDERRGGPPIDGGDAGELLIGDDDADRINGNRGDDIIRGFGGNDILSGGIGNDRIEGGAGNDLISGGTDNDEIWGEGGADDIDGGSGDDTMRGGAGDDKIYHMGGGSSVSFGNDDHDVINVFGSTSQIAVGGTGRDTISTQGGDDIIGANRFMVSNFGLRPSEATSGADIRSGLATYDYFDKSIDTIYARGGKDTITCGGGDIVDAGEGDDRVDMYFARELATETPLLGGSVAGGAGVDGLLLRFNFQTNLVTTGNSDYGVTILGLRLAISGMERLSIDAGCGRFLFFEGLGKADHSLKGGAQKDYIRTFAGADVIDGRDGDDTILAGLGNDTLEGGFGKDSLLGEGGADRLNGGDDDDAVNGGIGNDVVQGGRGDDTVVGGDGHDVLRGGFFEGAFSAGSTFEDGDDRLFGGAGNDLLIGDDNYASLTGGNDMLDGGTGLDRLFGRAGNDILEGGADNDLLYGSHGFDYASYRTAGGGVVVDLLTKKSAGAAGIDTLDAIEGVIGSNHADQISGDNGVRGNNLFGLGAADVIDGRGGNDFIDGGLGDDTLTGGGGGDRFVFKLGSGQDRITDFTAGPGLIDKLTIDAGAIDTFAEVIARTAQIGANSVITFAPGQSVTLVNVVKARLAADDFSFV